MNDYMRALHQRFYREPDFSELEDDIENTRQEVRDYLILGHTRPASPWTPTPTLQAICIGKPRRSWAAS